MQIASHNENVSGIIIVSEILLWATGCCDPPIHSQIIMYFSYAVHQRFQPKGRINADVAFKAFSLLANSQQVSLTTMIDAEYQSALNNARR